jgi:hypothetical protein
MQKIKKRRWMLANVLYLLLVQVRNDQDYIYQVYHCPPCSPTSVPLPTIQKFRLQLTILTSAVVTIYTSQSAIYYHTPARALRRIHSGAGKEVQKKKGPIDMIVREGSILLWHLLMDSMISDAHLLQWWHAISQIVLCNRLLVAL